MTRTTLSLLAAALTGAQFLTSAHDHCYYGGRTPESGFVSEVGFCPNDSDFGYCCDFNEEVDVQTRYELNTFTSGDCAELHKEVLCSICGPFSGHLYEQITNKTVNGLTMTSEFCENYVDTCEDDIQFSSDYCEVHTLNLDTDAYWSYPYVADTDFTATGVTKAFPNLDASDLPTQPMAMEMTPDGQYWWISGLEGQLVQVVADDPSGVDDIILQFTPVEDRQTSGFIISYEEGLLSFALSPDFAGIGSYFYVTYTYVDVALDLPLYTTKRRSILSKFTYTGNPADTMASEEILIITDPKSSPVHAAGWIGFKPSAREQSNSEDDLYWSIGDGGNQYDPDNRGQDLTTLLSSIVRITVPRGDTSNTEDKYSIPSGNVNGEMCAYGFRNPFRCAFDRADDTLYCSDVGQIKIEEVNIIECGKNYGWNRFEGDLCVAGNEFDYAMLGSCETADFSSYESPFAQFCHGTYNSATDSDVYTNGVDVCGDRNVIVQALIGGVVYRGTKYADVLDGKYLFADFQTGILYFVNEFGEGGTMMEPDEDEGTPGYIGYFEDNAGEVYLIDYEGDIYHLPCGDLCATTCIGNGNAPEYESVGCVVDSRNRVLATKAPSCPAGEDAMSPDICASYCATVAFAMYFGVEYSGECFCGSTDPSALTASNKCTMPCEGNPDLTCGGAWALELFSLPDAEEAPIQLGCFKDTRNTRIFGTLDSITSGSNSLQFCYTYCSSLGAVYFGLQYGKECWCGTADDIYDQFGEGDCTYSCSGDNSETCGGFFAMNVYPIV